MRGWLWIIGFCAWGNVFAAEIEVVGTTAYESNVYEALTQVQGGVTNKVSVVASGIAWRGTRGALKLEQQAAFKHIWVTAPGETQGGDVFVEQFFIHGLRRVGKRSRVGIRTGLKFKEATRMPGEESYLRGVVEGDVITALGQLVTGRLRVGMGGVDSRDVLLPESNYRKVGIDFILSKGRQLSAHVRLDSRWVGYDRFALELNRQGQIGASLQTQSDRLYSVTVGGQMFLGMLIQMDYSLLRNQSNSFGYAYWAHRMQGMLVRHLGKDIDAQLFVQFHLRLYDDKVPNLVGRVNETDAYEQSIGILKLSRQIGLKHVLAVQYGFYRNGAQQGDGFYRKHGFSMSFETKL